MIIACFERVIYTKLFGSPDYQDKLIFMNLLNVDAIIKRRKPSLS